jgi:hypothetical protein
MKTPRVPARIAVGICTSNHPCRPTIEMIAAITSARTMFVAITLSALARAHPARPQTRPDHQRPDRSNPEHHHRAAEEPVAKPRLPGAGQVLVDRQGRDVAGATAVEVAGAAMVDGVVVAPVRKGLEDEQAGEPAHPEVRSPVRQEGAMSAVVEDDEGAQQEARRRNCEGKADPDRDLEAEVHGHGQNEVGHDRGGQIEQAVANGGSLVASDRLAPVETVGRADRHRSAWKSR